jgi:hypothetical protein
MITSTWTFAPAGVLGQGSADARPYPGVAVRLPAVAPQLAVQGTGVPIARLRGMAGIDCTPRGEFIAQRFVAKHSTQNDGTTLGFQPSGRPLS